MFPKLRFGSRALVKAERDPTVGAVKCAESDYMGGAPESAAHPISCANGHVETLRPSTDGSCASSRTK
ncbi:hypothetical protein N7527_011956 [Penicillium freii]|nr:hypothetical protein N7527_011956 [Penicillium freii]